MKTLLISLLLLGTLPAMASVECYLNNMAGVHIDFNEKSDLIDTSSPFGLVRVQKVKGDYYLSSIINGEETITRFKKDLSIIKQGARGVSSTVDTSMANIVCR